MGSEDAEAVAALEPNRIQLMTVHGAKGLQFDHVLIPFCNRSANLSSTRDYPFVANGESWAMSWAVLDDDDKKLASPLAWEFACQQKKREQDENLRLLYVAITRAKKSLFMSWTGEAARDSWLNAMNWPTDSVGIHQGKNYRYAVSHGPWPGGIWKQTLSFEEQVVRPAYSASPPNFNKVNCYQEGVELNTINQETGRTSVTHRLAETADSAISQTENTEKLLAILTTAQRGTMVHRLFELIKYSAPATLNEYVSQWFNEGQDEVRSALSFVLKCQSPPLLDIIQSGYVEWGFVYFDQDLGTTLEGQIDLWGEVNDQVWLVDYKTGHSRYRDKALAQLQIYARALVALGYARSISDIRCVAVYPFESTKVEVRF
jgi:ATP-dependent helicase/nuclease subunit A